MFNLADLLFELSSQGWFMQMSAMTVSISLVGCLFDITWTKKIFGIFFLVYILFSPLGTFGKLFIFISCAGA
jgi:hypothetical protein